MEPERAVNEMKRQWTRNEIFLVEQRMAKATTDDERRRCEAELAELRKKQQRQQ